MPRPVPEVFTFMADVRNHAYLVPDRLNLRVVTPELDYLHPNALIDYVLRFRGMAVEMRMQVVEWEPPKKLVYEQIKGPYKSWRHELTFTELRGGTVLRDTVNYNVYGGFIMHMLFIRRDLDRIFEFRHTKLKDYFGTHPSG